MTEDHQKEAPSTREEDLDTARELLGRALRYLDQARIDPAGTVDGEDPVALLESLRGAMETVHNGAPATATPVAEPGSDEELDAPTQTIHRRSA